MTIPDAHVDSPDDDSDVAGEVANVTSPESAGKTRVMDVIEVVQIKWEQGLSVRPVGA